MLLLFSSVSKADAIYYDSDWPTLETTDLSTTGNNITFDISNSHSYSATMSGTGSFTKTGAGALTMSGTNGYSGGTTISGGTVYAGNNSALGSGKITLSGGTLSQTTGAEVNFANIIEFAVNTSSTLIAGGKNMRFSGKIIGTGTATQTGDSSLELVGDNSEFAGTFNFRNLSVANENAGSALAKWNISGSVAMWMATSTMTFGELNGSATFYKNATYGQLGTITLEIGALNTTSTFTGIFKDIGSGYDTSSQRLTAIKKVGTGVLEISGNNLYSGGTSIDDGILKLTGNGTLGSGTISTGTKATGTGTLEFAGTTAYSTSDKALSNVISGDGSVVISSGTTYLSGTNTYTGGTTISGGTVYAGNNSALGSGKITLSGGTLSQTAGAGVNFANIIEFAANTSSTLIANGKNMRFSGKIIGTGTATQTEGSALELTGDNSEFAGTFNFQNLSVASDNAGSALAKWNISGTVVTWMATSTMTFGELNGSATFYKYAAFSSTIGTLTLEIGALNTDSKFTGQFKDISSGYDTSSQRLTKVHKVGSGTLELTGNNLYSGGTVIDDGILKLTGNGTLGSGTVTLNGGTLEIDKTSSTLSSLTGSGNLILTSGTTTITAMNQTSGTTSLAQNSTLILSSDSTIASLVGAGNLNITGGKTTVTGAMTQTGGKTTLYSGVLELQSSSTIYNLSGDKDTTPTNRTINFTGDTLKLYSSDRSVTKYVGKILATGKKIEKVGNGDLQILTDAKGQVVAEELLLSSGRIDIKGYLDAKLIVDSEAVLSPGNSVGTITIEESTTGTENTLTIKSGGTLLVEINSEGMDKIVFEKDGGAVDFKQGSILELTTIDGYTPSLGDDITETLYANIPGIEKALKDKTTTLSSYYYQLKYDASGNIIGVVVNPNAVPEPSTWALLILGFAGLMWYRRRK